MKRFLTSMLVLTFLFSMASATGTQWQTLDKQAKSTKTNIKLVQDNPNHLRLEFDFNAYSIENVNTPKGTAQLINIPNCTRTKIKGAPDLPKISQALAIPNDAKMTVNVIKSRFIELDNILMAPSKGVMSRDKKTTDYPYEFGAVYGINAFYPSMKADLNEPYIVRNVRGQTVIVNPVQYNPVTKKVRIYTNIVVDVIAEGVDTKNIHTPNSAVANDAVYNSVLTNHFINYNESFDKYSPISEDGKKMLIVSYGSFMDEMEAFKSWKESIGYTVTMVDYATIGSSSSLKTYVQNQYDQNGISYLLLVGDHAQVPAYNASSGYSDNYYGYTSGNDHYLDLFVGRFSASTTADLQTQIDRTIYYEKDVSPSATWFKKGVGIASNEGGAGGDDGEDDETHMNNIEYDLEGYGYTINRVYQDGGSASQLSSLINAGTGIINYVGHGSDYTWASMVYTQSNVNALTNENKLPFIFSVACVVGNFTSKTCFAETWMRATNNGNPTGAIVFCGSTINQSWASPMCAQDEMNDLLVANSYINYGGVFVNGMFQMIDEYGTDGNNMADTWTVFGDPSVQMRTPGHPDGPDSGPVEEPPVADFSASTTTITEGDAVTFTSTSTNSPTSLSWSFAGGSPSTSTSSSPTVTYNTAGTYQVSLTATNAYGSDTETKNAYITVQEYVPTYCTSQGNDASYEWISKVDIGTFTNSSGGASYTDFTSQQVELAAGQTYNISLTPGFGSSTYNEYWKIWIDYNNDYDFDDAGELAFDAGSMSKTTVTGTITIPSGASGTTRMRVSMKYNGAQTACESFSYGEVEDYTVTFGTVVVDPPVAAFTANTTTITEGESVSFTDQSTNDPTSWSWSFTGGTPSTSTAQNPTVTYNTPGTYQVSLTATNEGGSDTETKYSYITVEEEVIPAPVAAFTANTTTIAVGGSVSFTDQSTNNPTAWSWSFAGGSPSSSSAQNPTVTYNTAGTYQVSLTATNAGGSDSETKSSYITVEEIVPEYCASKGNNVNYEWIAGVEIGSFTNNTGANGGYADFTAQTVELAAGQNVNVKFTPGFASSSYSEYWTIWIDYNKDYDFDDAGEQVYTGNGTSIVNGSFTVVSGASGTTRMRVTMKYNGAPTPCETFSYGEVEDYTVTFGSVVVVKPVANFTANTTSIEVGQSVSFSDLSSNDPTAWSWSFAGGSPSSSSAQNPTVTYNTAGTYQVSLTASNSAGSDTETKSAYITVTQGSVSYCASQGNNSSYEWIESFGFGDFTNTSGNNGGYEDFTNMTINLTPGASEPVTLTPGFSGSTYQEYWIVWIDYNKDGDFNDAGEQVGSGNGTGTLSGNLTIDGNASGTTRLRVTMKYNAAPTSCETFTYGEVEDYTVSFGAKETTGISDIAQEVNIYPQPADNTLHIEMSEAGSLAEVVLYNMNGQAVKTTTLNNNGQGFDLDVAGQAGGIYMLQIVTNGKVTSKRIVIK